MMTSTGAGKKSKKNILYAGLCKNDKFLDDVSNAKFERFRFFRNLSF
jgi:hypothetical protein